MGQRVVAYQHGASLPPSRARLLVRTGLRPDVSGERTAGVVCAKTQDEREGRHVAANARASPPSSRERRSGPPPQYVAGARPAPSRACELRRIGRRRPLRHCASNYGAARHSSRPVARAELPAPTLNLQRAVAKPKAPEEVHRLVRGCPLAFRLGLNFLQQFGNERLLRDDAELHFTALANVQFRRLHFFITDDQHVW